jgi:hypothetical protein
VRHFTIVTLAAIALAPRLGAAQSSAPAPGEPESSTRLAAPRLIGDVTLESARSAHSDTEQPLLGRRAIVLPPTLDADTASSPTPAFYTREQLRLARSAQTVYWVGVAAGLSGIVPFIVGFSAMLGAFHQGGTEAASTCVTLTAAGWIIEPVMMLVTDNLVDRALGRDASAANIAGWVMLALTIALPAIGGALAYGGVEGEAPAGLAITGAVLFLPMQILTDVVGSRAYGRASRMSRYEAI